MAVMLVHGITMKRNEIGKMKIVSTKRERANLDVVFIRIRTLQERLSEAEMDK